jgi:hypothetical protein
VVLLGACAALACATGSRSAHAEEPASADRLKSAAEEYDRGRRAFLASDFDGAAVHFESAFRDAPRAETLRLAIRARRRAEQLGRAASLAAVAQQLYGSDPATAQLAKETLDEAAPALQEYLVACDEDCAVTADGRVVSQSDAKVHRLYVEPGPHDLGVSFKSGGVARHIDAKRGASESLSFAAPAARVSTPPPAPATAAPPAAPAVASPVAGSDGGREKPLSPVVFYLAAGLTVAAGGATVLSGIDAKNNPGVDAVRRACAGKDESCPAYQDGKSAETRTNVLLGVTVGGAVITGVLGLFFTQWTRRPVTASVAPLPGGGSVGLHARF